MGFAKKLDVGSVIHCGDWDNLKTVDRLLSFAIPLYAVTGNADIDKSINKKLTVASEKFGEEFLQLTLGDKKVGVIHDVAKLGKVGNLDILFCGHIHRQSSWVDRGVRVFRPGALVKEVNFLIYDTDLDKVEFIHD